MKKQIILLSIMAASIANTQMFAMTFGFHSDSASGKTNFYATAASEN